MVINMDLESTIVTINNLLKLDFESSFSDFIQPQKQLMQFLITRENINGKNPRSKHLLIM